MSESQIQSESQHQRWLKYGLNVAVSVLAVVVIAGLLIYLAQRSARRIDTTAAGLYSLKPQTINIVNGLKGKVKLVSLYSDTKFPQGMTKDEHASYKSAVADLLDEYRRKSGGKVDVELIDPVNQSIKVDDLVTDVTRRYASEIQKYKEFLDAWPKQNESLSSAAKSEAALVNELPFDQIQSRDLAQTIILTIYTVKDLPEEIEDGSKRIERRLKQNPPDYKGATETIRTNMDALSAKVDEIISGFTRQKDSKDAPEKIRAYMSESLPRYQALKKQADDLIAQIDKLGELKLDTIRRSLREEVSPILVMGENEIRVISFNDTWPMPTSPRQLGASPENIKRRFGGEQQITSAMLALSSPTKPKAVFVRAGGAPLAEAGFPGFSRSGPLAVVAQRLRDMNFDVQEKDLSGQWEQQAQMRQMPGAPEPSDDEIKDALWIVINTAPQQPQNPMMPMPPTTIVPRVKEHLDNGGSALVLVDTRGDDLKEALEPWGVQILSDKVAVHETVKATEGPGQRDIADRAQQVPFVWVLNDYGDHLITSTMKSLEGVLVPLVPVRVTNKPGLKSTAILPLPTTPKSWMESDLEGAMRADGTPTFDEKSGDLPGPIFGGAVVEGAKGNRLVVIGSLYFATSELLGLPDEALYQRGILASRFPANGELVTNSVYWLTKNEPMIAISPAAMEVARLPSMSPGTLSFWKNGVLLVGLPGLVLVAGVGVWVLRRD